MVIQKTLSSQECPRDDDRLSKVHSDNELELTVSEDKLRAYLLIRVTNFVQQALL